MTVTAVITIGTVGQQVSGVPFSVAGTYAQSAPTWDESLYFSDDGSTPVAIGTSPVVLGASSFAFVHPGLPAGTHTVSIRDALTGTVSTSNSFLVTAPISIVADAPTGAVVGGTFLFTGTLTGYALPPPLTYDIDGGAPFSLGGVTAVGWSTTLSSPSPAGSHTIQVTGPTTASGLVSFTVAPAVPVITPATPTGVVANQAFTFSGSLSGYLSAPSLTYTLDGAGTPVVMTGVTLTGWSMTVIIVPTGVHTLVVSDGTTTGSTAQFTVTVAPPTITPYAPDGTVKNVSFTFSGIIMGYGSVPALMYSLDGAAKAPVTGVTINGWAMTLTIATSGSHTIVVTDASSNSGTCSFTTAAAVTPAGVTWNPSDLAAVTLSGGNDTATSTGSITVGSAPGGVRGTLSIVPTLVVAWEVAMSTLTQDWAAGVADAAYTLTNIGGIGSDTHAIGAYPSTGAGSQPAQSCYFNNVQLSSGNGTSDANGDVMSLVVNGTNFWFSTPAMRTTVGVKFNSSTTADPATNQGGFSFSGIGSPYYAIYNSLEGGGVAVINDGTAAFSTFLATYLAANPNVVALKNGTPQPAQPTVAPNTPNGVVSGSAFTFTGTLNGYAVAPNLTYAVNSGSGYGAQAPLSGVSAIGWSTSLAESPAGTYTIQVTDGTVSGATSPFAVAPSAGARRSWFYDFGEDGTFWVQPFQSSADWITTGPLVTALRQNGGSVNLPGNYASPFYRGKATDPLVQVTNGSHSISVHVPLGAVIETPASQFDQTVGGLDETQPYLVWSISGATMNTAGVQASGTVITGTYAMTVMDGSGPMMVDAVTGNNGAANVIGGVTSYELSQLSADPNYVIQHMLTYSLDPNSQCSGAGPIWPLSLVDTSGANTGPIPQGCTIGIPAGTARPAGQSRGFYGWWDCLQQFGAFFYNVAASGSTNFFIYDETGANASMVNDMVAQLANVMPYVCILNYASGVSGAQYSVATTKGAVPGSTNAFTAPPLLDLTPTGGVNVAPSTFGAWYPSGYDVTPTNTQ